MKIKLSSENYRIVVYEMISVFLDPSEIEFTHENFKTGLIINLENGIEIIYLEDNLIKYHKIVNRKDIKVDENFSFNMGIKFEIAKFFTNIFNKSNPWGVLTGIRPVKVSRKLLNKYRYDEALKYLTEKLLLNSNKAKLILDISNVQSNIIKSTVKDDYSVYINIPFCTGRCSYCSFSTLVISKNRDKVNPYIDALLYEMKTLKKHFKKNPISIYIGGGTPTALDESDLERLLSGIEEIYDLNSFQEFTVEAGREDSLSSEKLKILKKFNVTRISLNPQSFRSETLEKIGRNQNNDNLIKKYYEARTIGFNSINMDLIIGLPDETLSDFNITLNKIKELQPDNLTIHTLAIKKGSKLMQDKRDMLEENKQANLMMNRAVEFSKENGYIPYYLYRQKRILGNLENIGFSKSNKICKYNIYMMEEAQNILGIGMGSGSKFLKENDLILNHRNFMNMRDYLEKIEDIIGEKEKLIEKRSRN
ncbi:MAG: coproporphyrinogen dehydrogenase HemZ [Lagierella massiliensis]|nr:coproporphyrinogen dehydrogenase HemZ [Lagierella massiliensis]